MGYLYTIAIIQHSNKLWRQPVLTKIQQVKVPQSSLAMGKFYVLFMPWRPEHSFQIQVVTTRWIQWSTRFPQASYIAVVMESAPNVPSK